MNNNYSFREDWENWFLAVFGLIAMIITLVILG